MSMAEVMTLELRVPTRLVYRGATVKLTARAENGAFGILPNHADVVTALVPGVLTVVDQEGRERFFGIDEGVLVKQGHLTDICVRRAVEGQTLSALGIEAHATFFDIDDQERRARTALAGLESDIVRRFADLHGAR